MGSERKKSSSNDRSGRRVSVRATVKYPTRKPPKRAEAKAGEPHYAVCVRNDDYPASLELRKLYPVLNDAFAAEHGMIRVVDESGEDYLYPSEFFLLVNLPTSIEQVIGKIA